MKRKALPLGTTPATVRKLRCAIYTRVSTDENLDQAYNSLHAQSDSCAAYVQSQQVEGWLLNPDQYQDGGFSGGTLKPPALQRLLADIKAGKVDVIVVYKIDRLSRSLMAKLVEVFDAHGVTFVSVTQSFNTTTSMGRLTLNILLSFAQFEREVIGESIRDKFAAARARGLWMVVEFRSATTCTIGSWWSTRPRPPSFNACFTAFSKAGHTRCGAQAATT